eukprot:470902-Pelagomonas_calceolata.AAC.1
MHASKFGPIKSHIEDLEAVRGYHANTFALRIINANHACRVDFWESEGDGVGGKWLWDPVSNDAE